VPQVRRDALVRSKVLKFLAALLVAPSALLLFAEALKAFFAVATSAGAALYFSAGLFAYAAVHFYVFRAERLYVLAHELTHAAAALLTGHGVTRIDVGGRSGSVSTTGSNAFISLAPYCVPFYALCAALLFWLAGLRWNLSPYRGWLVGAIGFLLSFHYIFTYDSLTSVEQSDIKHAGGHLFSYVVIVAANSLVLLLCVRILYPDLVSVRACAVSVCQGTEAFWMWAWARGSAAGAWLWDKAIASAASSPAK